jgi:hypothetical protein
MFHVLGLSADVADAWRARTENFVRWANPPQTWPKAHLLEIVS